MLIKCILCLFLLLLLTSFSLAGNENQKERFIPAQVLQNHKTKPILSHKKTIMPLLLVGYGFSKFHLREINDLDRNIRGAIIKSVDEPTHIDDILQFTPAVYAVGLSFWHDEGLHTPKERFAILGTSLLTMGVVVNSLKYSTKIDRPDHSRHNSFPSGHTAGAFVGAEFLWQEFKDVSIWHGVFGYTAATLTGLGRVYNNRHWFTDVSAGAGIGILSTKFAYWLHEKWLHKTQNAPDFMLLPSVRQGGGAIGLALSF